MRNVQYSAIIHPFDMKLDDMARDSTNFFTMDKYGKDRRLSFLLLHPLLWATIGLGVYCLSYWHMWKYLLFIVGLILLAVVFLIILLSIKDNLVSRLRKTAKEKNTDLSGIVTKKKSASATEPKMTIRLRYLKVKYMVCRPYAKG
jgi:hypothetical protein